MELKHQTRPVRGLTIAHVTDLRDEERSACAHAIALAMRSQSRLVSMHANGETADQARIPRAVDYLVRWNELPSNASEGDEEKLGMRHERVLESGCDDPVDTLLNTLRKYDPDLVVAATNGREGLARLMFGSVAEALALELRVPSLIVPLTSRPFVSEQTGLIRLGRILVAVGDVESGEVGVAHAVWLAELAGVDRLEIELVHVQEGDAVPQLSLPQRPNTRFLVRITLGKIEEALVKRADEWGADLIVMATRGHDSVGDVLRGSHTERVLHRSPCPILSVPLPSSAR